MQKSRVRYEDRNDEVKWRKGKGRKGGKRNWSDERKMEEGEGGKQVG